MKLVRLARDGVVEVLVDNPLHLQVVGFVDVCRSNALHHLSLGVEEVDGASNQRLVSEEGPVAHRPRQAGEGGLEFFYVSLGPVSLGGVEANQLDAGKDGGIVLGAESRFLIRDKTRHPLESWGGEHALKSGRDGDPKLVGYLFDVNSQRQVIDS